MEKTISIEERIRRAEQIYNNRINNGVNSKYTFNIKRENRNDSKKYIFVKKIIMQIVVCSLLYLTFYIVSNNEYIFSKDFKNTLNSLLNTQVDFNKLYNDSKNYLSEVFFTNNEENVDKIEENINVDSNDIKDEEIENRIDEKDAKNDANTSNVEDINIGGAEIQTEVIQDIQNEGDMEPNSQADIVMEKSQMEIDAENIKKSISFEIPVEGYISSTFGLRNPTIATVPKNHTGIDIAANAGTVIKAATDGTVILASSYGDYGKHYKIQIEDVIIVYAHCKKLYLKEGDTVRKGQEIAEIGSTGNSTGSHLHFEIRKDGRLVDPQLILDI